MKMQINKISVHRSSKLLAFMNAMFALLLVPLGIIVLIYGKEDRASGFILILSPMFLGIITYINAAIGFWVYNFIAGRFGGLELTLYENKE